MLDTKIFPTQNNMGCVIKSIHPYAKDFIKKTAGKNKTILEIGAGYGFLGEEFIKHGYKRIILNDMDNKHIKIMKTKFKNHVNIIFKIGKVPYKMGLKQESVDGIYCMNVIHFLNYDEIKKFLNDCFTILKPGGIITMGAAPIFTVLNPIGMINFYKRFIKQKERAIDIPALEDHFIDTPHGINLHENIKSLFDLNVLISICMQNKFTPIKAGYLNIFDIDLKNTQYFSPFIGNNNNVAIIAKKESNI